MCYHLPHLLFSSELGRPDYRVGAPQYSAVLAKGANAALGKPFVRVFMTYMKKFKIQRPIDMDSNLTT